MHLNAGRRPPWNGRISRSNKQMTDESEALYHSLCAVCVYSADVVYVVNSSFRENLIFENVCKSSPLGSKHGLGDLFDPPPGALGRLLQTKQQSVCGSITVILSADRRVLLCFSSAVDSQFWSIFTPTRTVTGLDSTECHF